MKGTEPQAAWPAPANTQNDAPAAQARPAEKTISRISLALLDEYSSSERGYDPYDTSSAVRVRDVWRRKPKRD